MNRVRTSLPESLAAAVKTSIDDWKNADAGLVTLATASIRPVGSKDILAVRQLDAA